MGIGSMDNLKLQWKIFIYLLGFCVLLLIILWIFQTVFLSDMYKFVRKMEMEQAIALVEKNINSPELEDILVELEMSKEITVRPTREFMPPFPLLLADMIADQKRLPKFKSILWTMAVRFLSPFMP